MTPKTTDFLQRTQNEAEKNEALAVPLEDQRGLVLFPQGVTIAQQIELLRKLIFDLGAPPAHLQKTDSSPETSALDCQVTVEERAQLFNFLHP